jgi:predicted Zn-dependent protease
MLAGLPAAAAGNSPQQLPSPKFGSAAFIRCWNKEFCAAQSNSVAVLPKYGWAPYAQSAAVETHTAASRGDYLNDEIAAGNAMHWSHMPLRVFIGSGPGYLPKYGAYMREAMDEWTKAGKGRVAFVPVFEPEETDVVVAWVAGAPAAGESGNTRTSFSYFGGRPTITHVHIDIAALLNGRQVGDNEMKKTCLHELGHALGLQHSSCASDIMYWQSNPQQTAALGPRDAQTIQRWYSID